MANLHQLLKAMVEKGASDLHITTNTPPQLRIDGKLVPLKTAPMTPVETKQLCYSILTDAQKHKFEEENELDLSFGVKGLSRFRANVFMQRGAVAGAFRLIPFKILTFAELGLPPVAADLAKRPRGLLLVTGPTGSGKSTTLASIIDKINTDRHEHIITIEDPIEFVHGHKKCMINQRELGNDAISFAAALKGALREDPDVILVGEMRDLETISTALTAAETGHLVFATLHTQDAPQTIDRVIDVFPPHQQGQVRAQLAATLQGVVCQTLVKRATGRGRAVATEVLVTTPAVANLIREGKTYQIPTAMQAGRDLGMHTMDQHLAELVNTGVITRLAALEKAHDIDSFERLVHRTDPTDGPGANHASYGVDYGDTYVPTVQRAH